jgi:hypothetical protein
MMTVDFLLGLYLLVSVAVQDNLPVVRLQWTDKCIQLILGDVSLICGIFRPEKMQDAFFVVSLIQDFDLDFASETVSDGLDFEEEGHFENFEEIINFAGVRIDMADHWECQRDCISDGWCSSLWEHVQRVLFGLPWVHFFI